MHLAKRSSLLDESASALELRRPKLKRKIIHTEVQGVLLNK